MSRAMLLVICDFLLLSLLAIARFDEAPGPDPEKVVEQSREDSTAESDLIEVLRLSLDAERDSQETLSNELESTRSELEERERLLREREAALQETTANLAEQEETARRLAAERESLERDRERLASEMAETERERRQLAEQFSEAQRQMRQADEERVALTRQLGEVSERASVSAEQLKILQDSLREREDALVRARQELDSLEGDRRVSEEERREIETRLRIAETERQIIEQNLVSARTDLESARVERERLEQERRILEQTTSRLADGVGALAETTQTIGEEVRRSQPQSANMIFDDFRNNRVKVRFDSKERGLLGTSDRTYELETVLVAHKDSVYALMHAASTPFRVGSSPSLEAVDARIQLGEQGFRVNQINVFADDPRLLAVPVPREIAEKAGLKIFALAANPFRYPDAVLVTSNGERYGETGFRLEPELGRYVRMRASIMTDLFGEFSPGRADLVFSKTGEVLGIMVNNRFAVVLDRLESEQRIPVGPRFDPKATADLLSVLELRLSRLPLGPR